MIEKKILKINQEINQLNPCFKYIENFDIKNNDNRFSELFEVFKSIKNQKEYLILSNYKTNNINIISLSENKIIKILEGHESHITSLRYFINDKNNCEYLISSDQSNIVIVWDISNDYKMKIKIQIDYKDYILSCLLIFNINLSNYKNILVTSCSCLGYTKLYSFDSNLFLKNVQNTEKNLTNYLILWKNTKDNNYYIIECCFKKIYIYSLLNNNEKYSELISEKTCNSEHFSGVLYNINEKDLLLTSSSNGYIEIWNLFNKTLFYSIKINKSKLMDIIQWNNKYTIISDYENQSIKIIDIMQMKIIANISGNEIISVKKIKKIINSKYGQGILSNGNDNLLKLWSL